jgi:hypothetical protein
MKSEAQTFLQSNLNEIVNSFEVEEVVVRNVDADAEVESGVTAIDYFVIPELDKVGVLCIAH